jgi:hypothetical protein
MIHPGLLTLRKKAVEPLIATVLEAEQDLEAEQNLEAEQDPSQKTDKSQEAIATRALVVSENAPRASNADLPQKS